MLALLAVTVLLEQSHMYIQCRGGYARDEQVLYPIWACLTGKLEARLGGPEVSSWGRCPLSCPPFSRAGRSPPLWPPGEIGSWRASVESGAGGPRWESRDVGTLKRRGPLWGHVDLTPGPSLMPCLPCSPAITVNQGEVSSPQRATSSQQQTRMSASSATRELDELMASLSDFKVPQDPSSPPPCPLILLLLYLSVSSQNSVPQRPGALP